MASHSNTIVQRPSEYVFQPFKIMDGGFTSISNSNSLVCQLIYATSSHLYIINRCSGEFGDGDILGLYSFNFVSREWKVLSRICYAIQSVVLIHKEMLLTHDVISTHLHETDVCQIGSHGVKPVYALGEAPRGPSTQCFLKLDNCLYTFVDIFCNVFCLDMETKLWERIYTCDPDDHIHTTSRVWYRYYVVYDGRYAYLIDCVQNEFANNFKALATFDFENKSWHNTETLPALHYNIGRNGYPFCELASAAVQQKASNGDTEVYIISGVGNTFIAEIWRLNLRSKQWEYLQQSPFSKGLYLHSAALTENGCMYIYGRKRRASRAYVCKVWLRIPKLWELAWDALNHYDRNLYRRNRSTLLAKGIPKYLVDRLPPC